jgi:hypothetical protein
MTTPVDQGPTPKEKRPRRQVEALPAPDALLTQPQAAALLGVGVSYLRRSSCPKVLLPGGGSGRKPLLRYRRADLNAWYLAWRTPAGSR